MQHQLQTLSLLTDPSKVQSTTHNRNCCLLAQHPLLRERCFGYLPNLKSLEFKQDYQGERKYNRGAQTSIVESA